MRYAIYYTPLPDSPLARFGAAMLGYDCFAGTVVPHAPLTGIQPGVLDLMTVEPRRYGFHTTIIAPFTLAQCSEADIAAALREFSSAHAPLPCGRQIVDTIGNYIALVPSGKQSQVAQLAEKCLKFFDGYRVPLSAADRDRRMLAGLSKHQVALMDRWGYPYVLDQFRFHMTLAGPVPDGQLEHFKECVSQAYRTLANTNIEIDALSLMRQDDRHQRFKVIARNRLRGSG